MRVTQQMGVSRQPLEVLSSLTDKKDPAQRITKAEILRRFGRFDVGGLEVVV